MLAVVSDLHLTDCTTATNPHASAFQLLTEELKVSARNKEAGEIQVVLLGDIVDLVRTDWWHANHVDADRRPWGGRLDDATAMNPIPEIEQQFLAILERVLGQPSTKALIDGLKSLRDRHDRPPVKITYVVGNHDRVLHNFPSLKARIARELAPIPVEFATRFESAEYAVAARHGHEWDMQCHGWHFLRKVLDRKSKAGRFDAEAYRVMAIGEVITAELMSGFVHHLRQRLTSPADAPFLRMAAEVNNLRPQTDVIRWVTWRLAKESGPYLEASTEAFRVALQATLDCSLAKRWDALKADLLVSGDITDILGKALLLLKGKNGLRRLESLIPVLEKLDAALTAIRGHREDGLYLGAKQEFEEGTVPPGTQYLLYGHSHAARQDCLRARRDGGVDMYINTGTFLPLIERAADQLSFAGSNRMSYVCFYGADEDTRDRVGSGPTVEVWDGLKRKEYL